MYVSRTLYLWSCICKKDMVVISQPLRFVRTVPYSVHRKSGPHLIFDFDLDEQVFSGKDIEKSICTGLSNLEVNPLRTSSLCIGIELQTALSLSQVKVPVGLFTAQVQITEDPIGSRYKRLSRRP